MTLFIVARFPLGIVGWDLPSQMLWTAVLWSALLWFVELHLQCALSLQSPTPLQSYTQSRKGHHSSPKNTCIDFISLRKFAASFTWQFFFDLFDDWLLSSHIGLTT